MHELSAIIFFVGWPVIWFYGGRLLHRSSGWNWLVAYATTAIFGFFAVWCLIFLLGSNKAGDTSAGLFSLTVASIVGFCGYLIQRAIDKHEAKISAYESNELHKAANKNAGDAESAALHRMALRERDDKIQRLKFENEMLQDQLHSKRKTAWHKPKAAPKITGKFGTFEFDYIDADGNFSHRIVDANAVEDERFSGYCHEARAIRTFRYKNVMSDLVNLETGEVMDAELWADGVRRNQ